MSGAEFAPTIVVGYVTETGGFYATLDAVPMVTLYNNERVKAPYVEAVRQLSCDDPDDMRVIWLRAAAVEGADEEEQRSALLMRSATDPHLWILRVKSLREGPRHLVRVRGETMEEATAALCAHVWGPK